MNRNLLVFGVGVFSFEITFHFRGSIKIVFYPAKIFGLNLEFIISADYQIAFVIIERWGTRVVNYPPEITD